MSKTKAPAFQFYANDFMNETCFCSAFVSGLYVRMLCIQWTHGALPNDRDAVARACYTDRAEIDRAWPDLMQFFAPGPDGKLRNPRLESIRERQEAVSKARRLAVSARRDRTNEPTKASTNDATKKVQRKVKVKEKIEVEVEEEGEVVSEPREKKSADLPFASEAFAEAWANWEGHRRAKRSTLTPQARSAQLAKCAEWGEARTIAALKHSTANGYTGLFEPPSPPKQTPNERHQSGVIGRNDTIETSLRS